jgi:hypothetical protein
MPPRRLCWLLSYKIHNSSIEMENRVSLFFSATRLSAHAFFAMRLGLAVRTAAQVDCGDCKSRALGGGPGSRN